MDALVWSLTNEGVVAQSITNNRSSKMSATLIAGMALGFAGSFHCIGMCGPLALALPVRHLSLPVQWLAYLAYNLGRVATYSLLGLLLGLAGSGFVAVGWQQVFSIVAGSIILLLAILNYGFSKKVQPLLWQAFNRRVRQWVGFFLKRGGQSGFFLMGMANGLLPCGMVYMAITTALATGTPTQGTVLMMGFGLATVPNMLLLGLAGIRMGMPLRRAIQKATPYIIVCTACLLILRGLNLGIPYLSPQWQQVPARAISCH
jgi:uncharacterized protein